MRIALVSDAWRPQVNGVVRTLTALDASSSIPGTSLRRSRRIYSRRCGVRSTPKFDWRSVRASAWRSASTPSRRTRYTSSPKDLSGWRHAAIAGGAPFPSPPGIALGSPNTSPLASVFRRHSPIGCYADFTAPRPASWWRPRASGPGSPRAASGTCAAGLAASIPSISIPRRRAIFSCRARSS